MLNLLCIPFLSLLTHHQALRLRLQPELLGHNTYNREYFEIMRRRRGDHHCKKCGWFDHMAYQCRKKEIAKEGKRKSMCEGNRFVPLQSRICRKMEAAHPYEGNGQHKARCWGCGEIGHVMWRCPNRATQPRQTEVQQGRRVERRSCGECGGSNHQDNM